MDRKKVDRLFQGLSGAFPDPRCELNYKNNFELLIAVILSAQATDKTVNSVTATLFDRHPTPQAILALGEKPLRKIIRRIGLAPTKSKNILATCGLLISRHKGIVPDNRESLEALPGVGRKTANVVLNEAFGHPTIAVDTHVFRVANRTGLALGRNPEETEMNLLQNIPDPWKKSAHRYLILHGRYVCKAKGYNCSACVIRDECEFTEKKG